jgi:hypothetical protein
MGRGVALSCCAVSVAIALAIVLGLPSQPGSSGPPARPIFVGARIGDFLNQSAPGAVTEVPDPAGGGGRVFKLTVADSDVYPLTPTDNPRAELLSRPRVLPGHEYWWRAKFFLPRSFPASIPGWMTVLEGPYGAPSAGTPPWHIEINGGYIQWSRNRTYGWDVPWRERIVRGQWVKVLVHFRFATHGFVEMWIDGRRITFFRGGRSGEAPTQRLAMATLDASNDGGPNSVAILSYRKRGMFRSLTIYQGMTRLGPTRASVAE